MERRRARPSAWDAVWDVVRRIPRGRVMTYGQIAALLGGRLSPRAIGWALHGSAGDVPWQRVVNAAGACATERRAALPPGLQRALLEREGIRFRDDGTLDLERYRYTPRRERLTRRRLARSGACRP